MIKIFGKTDKNFTSNGDCVIQPFKAKVHKQDNGDYYLDLETSLDYVDYLAEGNIVVASVNNCGGCNYGSATNTWVAAPVCFRI